MADNWLNSFAVAVGFQVDTGSLNTAKRSIADYEAAVKAAEKRIEDARWAGAKTESEIAKLTRETNLKEAKDALSAAQEREKREAEQLKKREQHAKEFVSAWNRMALAATAAATAISYAVTTVTRSFDNLGFVSQRTGASVQALNSLGYAFKQVGGSSEQAIGAVESFAKAIRENSGVKSYVQSLGVDMTADTSQQLLQTVEKLNAHPYDVGFREAGLAGISEENYNLISRQLAQIKAYRAEYDAMTKSLGVNSKDATDASMAFQRSLNRLQATASALTDKLLVSLAPALKAIVDRFQDWIRSNPEKVERIMDGISKAVVWVAEKIGALVQSFTGSSGDEFMKRWEAFGDRVRQFADNIERIANGIEKIARFLSWASGTKTPLGDPQRTADILNRMTAERDAAPRDDRRWYEKILPKALGGKDAPTAGDGDGDGMRVRARRGLNRLARSGNVQAIVGELRQAGYKDNAIAAVVGSMETESSFNPRAANNQSGGHTGLWQWDRNRWPKVKNWIQSQGGDPYDAAWQTKAWVVEHNAKPGDPLYDHPRTARGGAILRNDPTIDQAIHGVRESERFGAGEEGGRARHAREWLPQIAPGGTLSSKPDQRPIIVAPPPAAAQRPAPNMTPGGFDVNNIDPRSLMKADPTTSPSVMNSTTSSSRSLTQNNTFKVDITGSQTPQEHARAFTQSADGLYALALRNAQSATV
ncbi:phage tail tip lysozyme [Methylobacterium phyllosphaerae]